MTRWVLLAIWLSECVQALRRLVEGGAFLAAFLLIESGLVNLARFTLHGENQFVSTVLQGIETGSALVVALLFVLHAFAVGIHYTRYLFRE